MSTLSVPTKSEVSPNNQAIFTKLESSLGFVPNLYAVFAHNDTALEDYLGFQNRKTTLKAKEKEIVNLIVSQVNGCEYCLAAHTAIGKMNGFNDDQILEIRGGTAAFDAKLDALAKFVKETAINKGKPNPATTAQFLDAGYSKANLVDVLVVIGDKTISNYLHGIGQFPVDFPVAPALEVVV